MSDAELKSATIDGRTLAWREAGSGPAIVFLHGIGSSSGAWAEQLAYFGRRHRAIAWDAPGYGGSDELSVEAPFATDYAAALKRLMGELGLSETHIVGISLGALMAAAFAANHGKSVASLVLSNVAVGHAQREPAVRARLLRDRIEDIESLGPAGLAEKRAPRLMGPNASPESTALVRKLMADLRPRGYAQAARMLSQENIFEHLRGWNGPCLVIGGTADVVTPIDGVREVAQACPGSQFETFEDVGHQPQIERPRQFNMVVDRFLQSVQELAA